MLFSEATVKYQREESEIYSSPEKNNKRNLTIVANDKKSRQYSRIDGLCYPQYIYIYIYI